MGDASRRVQAAAMDARSSDDLVSEYDTMMWDENDMLVSPLDEETLDERASTQMGPYEPRRRGGN